MSTAVQKHAIGRLCELVRGTSPTLKTEPGEYPLVVTAAFRRTSADWQLEGPAVCIPLVSSTGHGDAALHRVHFQDGKFALANLLVALIPRDPTICDAKYLYHLLQARKDDLFVPLMLGTANVSLKERDIASVEIALPPLHEQRRIVARIEKLSAKVEEARKLQDESKKALSVFVSATHADLSVSAPEPLSNFIELCEDEVPIEIGKPYPQAGVRGFGGGLFAKPPVYGGQTTYRAFNHLYSGALVMSQVKGWEGAVAMTPKELEGYFVSPEYRTFRCKEDRCLSEYLAALVPTEFFWSRLKDATRGVGARRERTRPEQFLELKFSMPSLSDQKRAIAMFATIDTVRQLKHELVPELDAMLPAILDKAFKGELA